MNQLGLHNISKRFGRTIKAVDDFSLTVRQGEFLVLLGPSGCGKTTVLRMIAGLETPDTGRIEIGGENMQGVQPSDRGVAMVHQSGAIYPHLSVRANIAFSLRQRAGKSVNIESRIATVAQQLGIAEQLDAKPGTLSGGQRQRAALARALVVPPKVLLLDEPLASLDAPLRAQLRMEIRSHHRRMGSTTIYVTHDHEDALTLSDQVAVMLNGKLVQADSPEAVYRRPVNRFVARFISQPCLNEVQGIVRVRDETVELMCRDDQSAPPILLDGSVGANLNSYVGKSIIMAFRPQALRLASSISHAPRARIQLSDCQYRSHGDAVDVHGITAGQTPIMARLAANTKLSEQPCSNMTFEIDDADLLFFETGENGARIGA